MKVNRKDRQEVINRILAGDSAREAVGTLPINYNSIYAWPEYKAQVRGVKIEKGPRKPSWDEIKNWLLDTAEKASKYDEMFEENSRLRNINATLKNDLALAEEAKKQAVTEANRWRLGKQQGFNRV